MRRKPRPRLSRDDRTLAPPYWRSSRLEAERGLTRGIVMRISHLIAALFAALLLNVALAQAQDAPKKIFHGVGEVTGVDADDGLLQLNHEAIPGLMDAMEMQYEVKPASLVQGVKRGDRIEFDVDGASLVVVAIHQRR
jgi:Cu/Ag efflux protein CusF